MHVIRLLSTTGSGGATVGEMPFVIMGQPTAGHIVAKTIKLAEGVYSQMPTTESVSNTYSGQGIYEGLILTYSSADGVRPESNIFTINHNKNILSEITTLGTKRYPIVIQGNAGSKTPINLNTAVCDIRYEDGFPADVVSGNSSVSRAYTPAMESGGTPDIADPPDTGTNWRGYFIVIDEHQKNVHAQGNHADWSGVVFKTFQGNNQANSAGHGYVERLDGGSVTWKKKINDTAKGDPQNGFSLYPCGTNGEDTLIVYSQNDGGMAVILANGNIAWDKDMLEVAAADTSYHYIDAAGAYAYTMDRDGKLYRVDLSDGTAVVTTTTYPGSTGTNTFRDVSNVSYIGGFDSDGFLWVANSQRNCITRMNVSGSAPIATGAYFFDTYGSSDGIQAFGILCDGDRIVGQLMKYENSIQRMTASWFFCLKTDFSTETIDNSTSQVWSKKYGLGLDNDSLVSISGITHKSTSSTGSWGAHTTTDVNLNIAAYTGSYDYDAAAAQVDTKMAATSSQTSLEIDFTTTVS